MWQNGHSNGLGRAAAGQTPRGAGAGGRFRGVARASFPSHPPGWPRPPNPCTRACQPHPIAFWGPLQCHAADTIGVTAACWEGGGRRGQRARTGLGVKCAVKKSPTEGGPSFIAAARSRAKTLHLMSRRSLGPSSRRRPALPSVGPPLLASHPHPSYQVRDEPTCHAAPSKPWAPFQRVQTLRHDGRFVPNSTARGDGRQKRHWKQAAQRGRKRPPPAQGERCRRAGQHGHRHLVPRGPRWQA